MSGLPEKLLCSAPKNGEFFAARCHAPAAWLSPAGPRCDACATREKKTIEDQSCLLAILAQERGISTETLLSRYRKIEP